MSVTPRLNRLFAADGKCLDVALDHGFFNEPSFLQGIKDMRQAIRIIVDAAPDAIQLTIGQSRHLQSIPGKQKPSLVRQAVELGADIIKADPCDNVEEYHLVVEAGGDCPVLPRGGGRVPAKEALARTKMLMAQGAAGIGYGRNIIQHENPQGMTRALMAIVHRGASLEEAVELLQK